MSLFVRCLHDYSGLRRQTGSRATDPRKGHGRRTRDNSGQWKSLFYKNLPLVRRQGRASSPTIVDP